MIFCRDVWIAECGHRTGACHIEYHHRVALLLRVPRHPSKDAGSGACRVQETHCCLKSLRVYGTSEEGNTLTRPIRDARNILLHGIVCVSEADFYVVPRHVSISCGVSEKVIQRCRVASFRLAHLDRKRRRVLRLQDCYASKCKSILSLIRLRACDCYPSRRPATAVLNTHHKFWKFLVLRWGIGLLS